MKNRVSESDLDIPRIKCGEAARRLGVSPRAIVRYANQGLLRRWKVGGHYQVAVEDVERMLQRVQAPAPAPRYRPGTVQRRLREELDL